MSIGTSFQWRDAFPLPTHTLSPSSNIGGTQTHYLFFFLKVLTGYVYHYKALHPVFNFLLNVIIKQPCKVLNLYKYSIARWSLESLAIYSIARWIATTTCRASWFVPWIWWRSSSHQHFRPPWRSGSSSPRSAWNCWRYSASAPTTSTFAGPSTPSASTRPAPWPKRAWTSAAWFQYTTSSEWYSISQTWYNRSSVSCDTMWYYVIPCDTIYLCIYFLKWYNW